jgi:hypothetical protein
MRRLLLGVAVLIALACHGPGVKAQDRPAPGPRSKDSGPDAAARAEARGKRALAAGRQGEAVVQFRKVVAYREAQLRALRARAGRICDVRAFQYAEGELSVARTHLAEAEGKTERLAELLPGVVGYYRLRIADIERLRQARAIETQEAQSALRQLNAELRAASDRLERVRVQLKLRKEGKEKM